METDPYLSAYDISDSLDRRERIGKRQKAIASILRFARLDSILAFAANQQRKKRRRSWFPSLWILLLVVGALFALILIIAAGATLVTLLTRPAHPRTEPVKPPTQRAIVPTPALAAPVTPAPAYLPPKPLKQFIPDTTLLAPGLIPRLTRVEVQLQIDASGRVTDARLANASPRTPQALAESAIASARRWIFEPARLAGKPVASDHTVVFEFHPPPPAP